MDPERRTSLPAQPWWRRSKHVARRRGHAAERARRPLELRRGDGTARAPPQVIPIVGLSLSSRVREHRRPAFRARSEPPLHPQAKGALLERLRRGARGTAVPVHDPFHVDRRGAHRTVTHAGRLVARANG
jgi:hypothetical protein